MTQKNTISQTWLNRRDLRKNLAPGQGETPQQCVMEIFKQ